MTERCGPRGEGGFTLLELMVSLGILVFGATALIGALGLGVGTRRSTEMRARAVVLADQVLHQVEQGLLAEHPLPDDWQSAEDLALPPARVDVVDGFPGMRYSVQFTVSQERPDLVLATIEIAWRDQGDDQAQQFHRLLPRAVPLARRIEQREGRAAEAQR